MEFMFARYVDVVIAAGWGFEDKNVSHGLVDSIFDTLVQLHQTRESVGAMECVTVA
jgi:hypothetical protein